MSYPKFIILLYCYTEYTECQAFFPVVRMEFPHPLRSVAPPPFGSKGRDTLACWGGGKGPNIDEEPETLVPNVYYI
jgi:hypothetical protein